MQHGGVRSHHQHQVLPSPHLFHRPASVHSQGVHPEHITQPMRPTLTKEQVKLTWIDNKTGVSKLSSRRLMASG